VDAIGLRMTGIGQPTIFDRLSTATCQLIFPNMATEPTILIRNVMIGLQYSICSWPNVADLKPHKDIVVLLVAASLSPNQSH
jgi:hypothetical protein